MGRIVVFTLGWPSKENGTGGIFNLRTIEYLIKKGLHFEIIHFRAWKPGRKIIHDEEYAGIKVKRIAIPVIPNNKFNSVLIKINYLWLKLFAKNYAQGVIKNNSKIYTIGLLPLGKIVDEWNNENKPHLIQAIGSDVNIFLRKYNKKITFKTNTKLQFNSEALKAEALKINPLLKDIYHYVNYRGVDIDIFNPEFKKPIDEIKFLYLGGIQTFNEHDWYSGNIKGGAYLLDAWTLVSKTNRKITLLFGGPGSDSLVLKKKIKDIPNIELIGSVKPDNVPALLKKVHITIIPSLYEGLPNLANESQACGVPVLGTNVGGIPETVINEKTGYVINPSSAEEIINGIQKFIDNSDNLKTMAENAVNHIRSNFTWDNYFEKFYKAINNIE